MKETKITKRNYDIKLEVPLSVQEIIMLKALDNDKNMYVKLSKNSKTKYRKLADKIIDVDLSNNLRELLRNMQICSDNPMVVDAKDLYKK